MNRKTVLATVLFLLALVGCGGGGGKLTVEDVWGRNSPMAAGNGAFYMRIVNGAQEEDRLISASAEVCGTVELHESMMGADGMMMMRPVMGGAIPIPAGQTVELKVGGLHVMCIDKAQPFTVGERIPVKLVFEKAGTIEVTAEIREP